MPARVMLRELQERHREALGTYGKRRTFFWWWRWLWGYSIYNNQRIQNAKIDGKVIGVMKDQLAVYDKKPVVIRWLYRLFTPIEKQRSLLCYYALQKLSHENIQERDEQYYYAMLKKHASKLRSIYLKPIVIAFVNNLRPAEEPLYKRMYRPPSDQLPRNPKFAKTQNHAVIPVGQAYDAKEAKELDLTKATPNAKAFCQQYQLDMQELDKLVDEVKQTLHQYKEDEMPEKELKAYWQDKLKILDKFYRKFAIKYHPDKSTQILQDEKLANDLFVSLKGKYEKSLESWLIALNGNKTFEEEAEDLLRKYDDVLKKQDEVLKTMRATAETHRTTAETHRATAETHRATAETYKRIIKTATEISKKQDALIEKQREAIRVVGPRLEETASLIEEVKKEIAEMKAEMERKRQRKLRKQQEQANIQNKNNEQESEEVKHASPRPA